MREGAGTVGYLGLFNRQIVPIWRWDTSCLPHEAPWSHPRPYPAAKTGQPINQSNDLTSFWMEWIQSFGECWQEAATRVTVFRCSCKSLPQSRTPDELVRECTANVVRPRRFHPCGPWCARRSGTSRPVYHGSRRPWPPRWSDSDLGWTWTFSRLQCCPKNTGKYQPNKFFTVAKKVHTSNVLLPLIVWLIDWQKEKTLKLIKPS